MSKNVFVFCLLLSIFFYHLGFFPTFYNMQSVSNNAVAQQLKIGGFIKSISSGQLGTITVPSGQNYIEFNTKVPSGHTIIACKMAYWSANTGCFSLVPYLSNRAYVIANSGTKIYDAEIISYYI